MRKFFVSDIHGHLTALEKVLEKAQVDPAKDLLVFGGDYIDRGKKSVEVCRLVQEYQKKGAIALMGNHEQMHIMWAAEILSDEHYFINGGKAMVKSMQENFKTEDEYIEFLFWLRSLKPSHIDDEFVYVHAGVHPYKQQSTLDDLLWIREEFLFANKEHLLKMFDGRKIVHGHTPMRAVMDDGVRINCDIGAAARRELALVDLTNNLVYAYQFDLGNVIEYAIRQVESKFR